MPFVPGDGAQVPPGEEQTRPLPLGVRSLLRRSLKLLLSPLPQPEHPLYAGDRLHLRWRLGWVRGWMVRPLWRARELLGGPRVRVGRRFSLHGSLKIHGPGTVIFGDDVVIHGGVVPSTHTPRAEIRIGDRTQMQGTKLGCVERIDIGPNCLIADSKILDTDFHPISQRRSRDPGLAVASAPIRIGSNVWVGSATAILKGVSIGENSVISFGAVVLRDIPANMIAGGNPARAFAPVPP